MEYTIQKLARLAGVSTRTLRYYDSCGLLPPARISSSGYRIYGPQEVDRLQQILFYRELGVDLDTIKRIATAPSFNRLQALKQHHEQLLAKRMQLDALLTTVEQTIKCAEEGIFMHDEEKFAGFKQQLIAENEAKYGQEIRGKYGDPVIDEANRKLSRMTPEEYTEFTRLERELMATLAQAVQTGNPASELAQKAADLHKQWLTQTWPSYSPEAHANLAQMYVDDERFTAYYDAVQTGTAAFLRDAIHIYTCGTQ